MEIWNILGLSILILLVSILYICICRLLALCVEANFTKEIPIKYRWLLAFGPIIVILGIPVLVVYLIVYYILWCFGNESVLDNWLEDDKE